ncbi:MAG: ABC transporter related protein [Candidatus Uhrbacteria bacterium GW2011_GWF2_41_16]|uniref:ABC transporter related protein n=2 Tax=Candidatus Uhriibacteriota TaxID=1752732 RepID=A0A0G0XJA4_9BACT|nr:MAG: ABC transporter related protein [Candidatus Uhrbacteria bacterium GW2011_GWA2_41_10]KKR85968.1 MAG: ABC transporter related protein [Candidatus Uhrbacteria bacterium GW2011_GWC2_41_11]KKR96880.1 MAG: ABC transporter related protein [Candidatus Uhrbacteria bacterium GW2011_GWF2_41_16]HBP00291.1 hypothetical protein [Candidatus Uhrbacteria bacterium]
MKKWEIQKTARILGRTFIREIHLLFSLHPGHSCALCLTQIVTGIMPAIQLFFTAKIITIVAGRQGVWTHELIYDICILLVLLLVQRMIFLVHDYVMNRLQNLLYLSVNDRVHRKIASLDLVTLEKPEIQTMITLFKDESWRPYNMVRTVFDTVGNVCASFSFIFICWKFSPILTSLFLLALFPSLIVSIKTILSSQHIAWGKTRLVKRAWYLQGLFLDIHAVTSLVIHGMATKMADKYQTLYSDISNKERAIERKKLGSSFITNLFVFGAYSWAYVSLVTQTIAGVFTIGDFTLYAGSFVNVERFLVSQVWQIVSLFEHATYVEKFHELEDLRPLQEKEDAEILSSGSMTIEFRNVSYQYAGSSKKVLEDISFMLKPGERVALVGENGAGKTTLVKLLLRLYDPTSGIILINGKDSRLYTIESVRRCMAVTFQDFLKLALSARDNIAFGVGNEDVSQEKIVEAAIRSGAHKRLNSLPRGYETCLGHGWEEDGVELSGGEWQKVALARSLVKDASILILDEPTAALDARSEFHFFQDLFRCAKNVSLFLISHRFSSVRVADRILVLQNGIIIEEGTHEQLMKKEGLYADLYAFQLKEITAS